MNVRPPRRTAQVYESLPDAVVILDTDRCITSVNRAFEDLFRYSAQEVIGRSGRMLYANPGDFNEQGKRRFNLRASDPSMLYAMLYKRKDGKAFLTETRSSVVVDGDGKHVGFIGIIRDVTPRQRREDLMRRLIRNSSQQDRSFATKIRTILENSRQFLGVEFAGIVKTGDARSLNGFLDCDHDDGCNPAVPRLAQEAARLALERDKVLELGLDDLVGAGLETQETAPADVWSLSAPLHVLGRLYGALTFVAARTGDRGPIGTDDKFMIEMIAAQVSANLVDHQRTLELEEATRRIRDRERQYRDLYRNTPAMLHSIDESGRLIEVSDRWLDALGYERDEVIGRKSTDFLTPESAEFSKTVIPQFFREGAVTDIPYRFVRKDGGIIDIDLSAILVRDEASRITRSLAVLVDVSERNISRVLLERKNDELTAANENLSRYAYVAAHDLQEPLRKIQLHVDMLSEAIRQGDQDEIDYSVGALKQAAARSRSLVSDLLSYSRLTNQELSRETVDLSALVADVAAGFERDIAEAEACITLPTCSASLNADALQLTQMIGNLIGNAAKYRAADRRLEIEVEIDVSDDGGAEALQVRDNGIGFEQRYAERIFEPFQRLHRQADYPGSGIGLAICAAVAKRHGWRIEARGEPNVGATFSSAFGRHRAARRASEIKRRVVDDLLHDEEGAGLADAGQGVIRLLAVQAVEVGDVA